MAAGLKRAEILRRKRDLNRVIKTGRRIAGPALYLRYAPIPEPDRTPADNREPAPASSPGRRVAFLLSGRIDTAVERNRLKRRLREIYRRNKDWFPEGFDYLLQATPTAARFTFTELLEQMRSLAARLRPDGTVA